MSLYIAKYASLVTLGLALAGLASAQTYRQTYPLPDGSDLSGLSVNLNNPDPTEAQVQQIQDAGFKFVRYELTWAGIEKSPGVFDWTTTDRAIAKFRAHGLRIMGLLAYSNPLYTTTGAPNTPSSRAAFANYAAQVAAHYQHQGVIWEIYNEPNLAGWWPNPSAADYAALVNAASGAIRGVSSDEWIVALSTQAPQPGTIDYVTAALDGGILANVDGISLHPYMMSNPETALPNVALARTLIDYRSGARRIPILCGEVGYSRVWSGLSETLQATYLPRVVLGNLAQGIGFTNLFSYEDAPGTADWHGFCGLVTRGTNVPYAAYGAIARMTTALSGYKFTKQLSVPNANDYVLLFSNPSNPNDCKLVAWTTDVTHTAVLPSSPVALSSVALTTGTTGTVTATLAGLSVPLTGEVSIYASPNNPLLGIAGQWGKLAHDTTITNRADAVAQLGALIASPAWASAPAGTTLKIEDAPTAVPGYTRPAYTATLGGLSTLTSDSAAFQTVFNSLGAVQDAQNATRLLSLTVSLPDGTSVTQKTWVWRRQPMAVFPTTPQSGSLTIRVENPTNGAFQGTVKAISGVVSSTQNISFAAGESFKMVYFPSLLFALIGGDVSYQLFDASGNAADPATPVVGSAPGLVYRSPGFGPGLGYAVVVGGGAGIVGSASVSYGAATWSFLTGGAIANLNYSFGAGGAKYAQLTAPSAFTNYSFAKTPVSIGMWVKGDGNGNTIRAMLLDASNQTFQVTGPKITWTGWQWVSIPVQNAFTASWGGAHDGVAHGAMRVIAPFLLDSNQLGSSGTVSIFGITVVGQK